MKDDLDAVDRQAELRNGRRAQAQADIAAAQKLDPKIAAFFAGIGLRR